MLAFVTSLRHPRNSADYARVERLLARTLQSVVAQSHEAFTVIVVGNRAPSVALPDGVRFVAVDFPPPSPQAGPRTPLPGFVRDKGTKVGIGLAAARQHDPSHVMIFDADDFVHRDLARVAAENRDAPGWVVDRGLMYSSARGCARPIDGFNRVCGTCHIVAYDTYAVPGSLQLDATQEDVVRAYGERLPRIMGAHRDGLEWFSAHGAALAPLPFRGAVYHVDTGENHSGKQMTGIARPLSSRAARTFGIERERSPARELWAALGPRPLAQTLAGRARRVVPRSRRPD